MICFYNMSEKDVDILNKKLSSMKDRDGKLISSLLSFFKNSSDLLWKITFEEIKDTIKMDFTVSIHYSLVGFKESTIKEMTEEVFNFSINSINDIRVDNLLLTINRNYQAALKKRDNIYEDVGMYKILEDEDIKELKLMTSTEVLINYGQGQSNKLIPLKHSIYMKRNSKMMLQYLKDSINNYQHIGTFLGVISSLYRILLVHNNHLLIEEVIKYFYVHKRSYIYSWVISRIDMTLKLYKTIIQTVESCIRNEIEDEKKVKEELINANEQLIDRFSFYKDDKLYQFVECIGIDIAYCLCKRKKQLKYEDILIYMTTTNVDLNTENKKSLFNKILKKVIEKDTYDDWKSTVHALKEYINWNVFFTLSIDVHKTFALSYLNSLYESFRNKEEDNKIILKDMKKCFYIFFTKNQLFMYKI